jgi:hypothetical protein
VTSEEMERDSAMPTRIRKTRKALTTAQPTAGIIPSSSNQQRLEDPMKKAEPVACIPDSVMSKPRKPSARLQKVEQSRDFLGSVKEIKLSRTDWRRLVKFSEDLKGCTCYYT